jgi:hypothetical protein
MAETQKTGLTYSEAIREVTKAYKGKPFSYKQSKKIEITKNTKFFKKGHTQEVFFLVAEAYVKMGIAKVII